MEPKKIALIGATGFIGRHLLEALAPMPVRVLVHRTHPTWLSAMRHIEPVSGDLLDPASLDALLVDCNGVINLSGQVHGDVEHYLAVNLQGTIHLAQACLRHSVRRVIHTSSALVYGDALNAAEDTPCRPITPYATMKLAAEEILRGMLTPDRELTCFRLSNLYGPHQKKGLMPYLIGCILNRQPITIDADGAQVRDFVHVRDVADVFVRSLSLSHGHGVFNIGSGVPTSVMTLLRLLEEILEVSARGQYRPEHAGGERRNTVNIDCATTILGWKTTIGLPDGIRSMLSPVVGSMDAEASLLVVRT